MHACTMTDAQALSRRIIPSPRQALNLDRYLTACRAKGATTREERARLLHLGRQSVYRYEVGLIEPKVSTAQWIASQLDVPVEALWTEELSSRTTKAAA